MWIFTKLKLWEILLFSVVVLLAALVYETHNAPGRYIHGLNSEGGDSNILLDTATGKKWKYNAEKGEWDQQRPAILNRSHSIN